jgi:hypothetical protein
MAAIEKLDTHHKVLTLNLDQDVFGALRSYGGHVLLFREPQLYTMTDFINRYTEELVRFAVGLSVVIRAAGKTGGAASQVGG